MNRYLRCAAIALTLTALAGCVVAPAAPPPPAYGYGYGYAPGYYYGPPVSVGVMATFPPTVLAPSVIAFVSRVSFLSFRSSDRVVAKGTFAVASPSFRPARANALRASDEETRSVPDAAVWSGAGSEIRPL